MNIAGIIPARYNSTRFPGKPLVEIDGKTMIQRVYEQARQSGSLSKVMIATDDERIYDHVQSFTEDVYMTKSTHLNGTERCAEVLNLADGTFDAVINIQGDEPYINPKQITQVAELLKAGADIGTLVKRVERYENYLSQHVVKVVFNKNDEALYFSRSPIPYYVTSDPRKDFLKHDFYKHIGIYGYQTKTLKELVTLLPTKAEQAESLEQLRWLESGYSIKIKLTQYETIAIDTPQDLERI